MSHAILDERTLKALEFGKVREHLAGRCLSEAGKDACRALVPFADLAAVHHAHRILDMFRTWQQAEGTPRLTAFPDIRPVFGFLRVSAAPLDIDALWTLREALMLARTLAQSLRETDHGGTARYPDLAELADHPLPEMAIAALNRCVGDDGLLRDESAPELMLARTEIRRLHRGCLTQVKEFSARYNIGHYLQDEYMTLASDRYVLPIKSNFKGRLQGIIHDYSQTGETCYFEPMFLVEQNNRLQDLKREEREAEHKVMQLLSRLVRDELDAVLAAWDLLISLDTLQARCRLGDAYDGVSVTMAHDSPLNLLHARHPLLALDLRDKVQPLDLCLRAADRALIISGGNAGGKTVCLKTLGLITVMTLAGLPVPVARGGTLPWWPVVHAFIGDEQSLDDHVSTFTAQIQHLNGAWADAGQHSLVLLDEFGAGTDPSQGAALAQAVIDELLERDATVVAATHFPALKTYALTRDRVRAASVLFDPSTRRPLFCLAYDQVGASQALDVAREHGLPEAVLRRAEQYLLLDGQDSAALIERLNTLGAEREREITALREENAKTRDKRLRLQERFDADRAKLERELREASRTILHEYQAGRVAHKQAMRELAKLRADLATQVQEPQTTSGTSGTSGIEAMGAALDQVQIGQSVRHKPWNKTAIVREIDTRQNRLKLDMGGVTLWADAAQVGLLAQSGAATPPPSGRSGVRVNSNAGEHGTLLRLDLRGMRADVAEAELLRFLDAALLAGRDEVEIVHGRGTGALRKQVHTLLKTFPGVGTSRLAPEDRGGDGMTLVTFR